MRVKDAVGKFGEQAAAQYLTDAGLVVVERNWRCARGEIDIIARDGPALVFVEVKTRSSVAFGDPAEAVTPAKAGRIRLLAAQWLSDQRATDQRIDHKRVCADRSAWREVRFDVVCVVRRAAGSPVVRHLKAAF